MYQKAFSIAALSFISMALGLPSGPTPDRIPSKGPVDPSLYSGLVWRNIGPFRGGRVSAVSGAVGQPGVFYAGMPRGGVWKSTNSGVTWEPIFDDVKDASSVGSVQVAPSDPNIVYVGLGDGTQGGGRDEGNGIYRSSDAGKTWTHIGLEFARQIPRILVDPKDPNTLVVAVLGDSKNIGPDRGAYRSTDGGKTWTKTLVTDYRTGVQDLAYAYDNPKIMLATTNRRASASGNAVDKSGPTDIKGGVIVKSVDGGMTWKALKGGGVPEGFGGRTSVAVAINTNGQRMFFVSNSGLWRSDDGGTTWQQMDKADGRVRNGQGGYNCGVYVNSKDPDTVYVLNTCSYISHDGGKTFTGFKGAPGGDDPQQMWIDPTDGNRMFLGVDQGPTVSMDGGRTWSPWYNIANGQFYHISVSNSWPYWIYATMQDSGAIGMSSRGIYGEITPLDWNPNPGWEWGSIAVDPLNANTLFSTGQSNDIIKQSFPTGQWVSIGPDNDPKLKLRHDFNQPIMFSPFNPHELFLGYQFLMSSTDGGKSWRKISPDFSQGKPATPATDPKKKVQKEVPKKSNEREPDDEPEAKDEVDTHNISRKDAMERAQDEMDNEMQRGGGSGSIASLSPSSLDGGIIWAGLGNGGVRLTKDHGRNWEEIAIPDVKRSIASIDASHTDPASAYVVVSSNTDPMVYRTKNFGKTWTKIVGGLPTNEPTFSWANVIRADTKRDGLLFLGTESSMFVSFDDGDHWQPLRLNLPNTSFRDMIVHDNDLVVGTYGRSFWILDDISPLRQVDSKIGSAYLFAPGEAIRVRRNVSQDTPMPPEVPHSLNAPPGALIYYFLGKKPASDIYIDVTDGDGKLIRHYSSAPLPPAKEDLQPIPDFWKEVPKPLPTELGTNRINWDLRYENPPAFSHEYNISATPFLTPTSPQGPLVLPGTYTVTLTVDGQKFTQSVSVKNDPRSPASARDLKDQHRLQVELLDSDAAAMAGIKAVAALKTKIAEIQKLKLPKDVAKAVEVLSDSVDNLGKSTRKDAPSPPTYGAIQRKTIDYLGKMDYGDIPPSRPIQSAVEELVSDLAILTKAWKKIQQKDIPSVNEMLKKNGLSTL